MQRIDLNCDMGESYGAYTLGNDRLILPYVSSVNIACGYHAGDPRVMRQTVEWALEEEAAVGAHPGFPDLQGFGRRYLQVTPEEVYDMVLYQIGALYGIVRAAGGTLHHVKPHGALYNLAARQPDIADAIARAVHSFDPSLVLYGLSGSCLVDAALSVGLRAANEAFADRAYRADGTLMPRSEAGAVLHDVQEVFAQVTDMLFQGGVHTPEGTLVPLRAETICIHGDSPNAATFAEYLCVSLLQQGIEIEAP